MKKENKRMELSELTKGSAWDVQENDIQAMILTAQRDIDFEESWGHYLSVIKSAFSVETYKDDDKRIQMSLEKQGYKLLDVKSGDKTIGVAIKKKVIRKITDFTYENIHHVTTAQMLNVLSNNFDSGWESIPQSVKDIIEQGFDISTTTLPKERLKKKGGMYEKKKKDGFDVLEIPRGTWVEAIFAKQKPLVEVPKMNINDITDDTSETNENDNENYTSNAEEEEEMTEDNYGTLMDISTDLNGDEDGAQNYDEEI